MGDIADESSSAPPKRSASIFLQIKENPDGSITRPPFPLSPPNQHPRLLIEDLPLNPAADTRLRLYLPIETTPPGRKLPVILFFHGGGFVLFGPDALFYDEFCRRLSVSADAVVVSASYRLAPEHRLPAAYEDGVDAVEWVRGSRGAVGERIGERGDLSRFFVMGSSSGGNLAYHAGLHSPSKITGLILNQPYFGGTTRTKSEAASDEDPVLPLFANDMMWRLALPVGSDRDHEYCNPAVKTPVAEIERLPRIFVKGSKGDPLVDRQLMFVEMLERAGADVVGRFDEDGCHAVELFDAVKAEALCEEVKEFVHGCC